MTIKAKVNQDDEGLHGFSLTLQDEDDPEKTIILRTEKDIANLVVALSEIKLRLELGI